MRSVEAHSLGRPGTALQDCRIRQCLSGGEFREAGGRSGCGLDRRLGLLLARRPRNRAAPVVGLPAVDEQPAGQSVCGAGHPDRRRRGTGRSADISADHGAVEPWPPNAAMATRLLHPRGVVVVAVADGAALPFADRAFDLVTSRHPNTVWWTGVAARGDLSRPAHRTCHRRRAHRILHRRPAAGMSAPRSRKRTRSSRIGRPADREHAAGTVAPGILRHRSPTRPGCSSMPASLSENAEHALV